VLTIPSYNDGEFDSSVPSGEPETPEPPPIEEDRQLTSRAPGSESAVIEAARQRSTPAARSQRAAERAGAASPESTSHPAAASPANAASAPASTDVPTAAAAGGSPRPAEPSTTPMETDEPHAAPPSAAAASGEGGAEGAAPSRATDPDENVTVRDLFGEDGEEGGGALSSPLTHALAP
jgi:hypothetical protein